MGCTIESLIYASSSLAVKGLRKGIFKFNGLKKGPNWSKLSHITLAMKQQNTLLVSFLIGNETISLNHTNTNHGNKILTSLGINSKGAQKGVHLKIFTRYNNNFHGGKHYNISHV